MLRWKEWVVAFNFVACDRDQELLLPPSLREWLAEDHLAWFVLDAVDAIDWARSTPSIGTTAGVGRRSTRR
jgi:hypothetical protein